MPFSIEAKLAEHANAEGTTKYNTTSTSIYYNAVANGGTIVSASITTTKKCAIVVVASIVIFTPSKTTDIMRGGVSKTIETTISAADSSGAYMHLPYATEILEAGTYTYSLVNTSGVSRNVVGATMKIVAVEA